MCVCIEEAAEYIGCCLIQLNERARRDFYGVEGDERERVCACES